VFSRFPNVPQTILKRLLHQSGSPVRREGAEQIDVSNMIVMADLRPSHPPEKFVCPARASALLSLWILVIRQIGLRSFKLWDGPPLLLASWDSESGGADDGKNSCSWNRSW
jgi:hypothetical protein